MNRSAYGCGGVDIVEFILEKQQSGTLTEMTT